MFSNIFIHFWLLINRINSSISHFQLGKLCYFFLSGKRSWGVIFFATSIRLKAIPCPSNAACLHPVVHPLFIWSLSQDACGVSTARLAGRRLPSKRALLAMPGRMVLLSSRDHAQLRCPARVPMGANSCKSWVQPFCATQREVGSWENHVLLRGISAEPSTKLPE